MREILRVVLVVGVVWCVLGNSVVTGQGLAGAGALGGRGVGAVKGKDVVAELDRVIPQLMKDGEVPGLQIGLVRGGKVVWVKSFGVKNAETGEPVRDDTIFEAASLSKPMFAYAVMKLVEAGKLDLDKPLQSYLKEPYLKDDERINLITARMALDHTTGFPNESGPGRPLKINFAPGEKFSYSGAGFLYLQRVVEQITGEPLDTFMKRTVFDPLGMADSSYVWQARFEGRKANGHRSAGQPSAIRKPAEAWSYATLHTTAADYAKFVAAVAGGRGLKRQTFAQIWTPQVRLDESCVNCIGRGSGRMSDSLSWGLGFGLERTAAGQAAWQWGDNNGEFHGLLFVYPKEKIGLVIFTNSGNGHSIIPEIVKQVFGGEHPVFAWTGYDSYKSPARVLYRDILTRGDAAVAEFRASRKGRTGVDALKENQVNQIGYALLGKKLNTAAIEMFRINVEDHPDSFNTYDSLGEAYMINGDKDLAIKNLQRSLELNPKNTHAVELLKQLGVSPVSKAN